MQGFHRLYLQYGIGASSILIFVAAGLNIKLDEHGWSRSADILIGVVLAACLVAPVCFLINLFAVRNWRCPRCHTETIGWVEKGNECYGCGLKLRTHI